MFQWEGDDQDAECIIGHYILKVGYVSNLWWFSVAYKEEEIPTEFSHAYDMKDAMKYAEDVYLNHIKNNY